MKVTTEQHENRQAVVQVEVEPTELEKALESAYKRVARQVNIPGFRPGKAPRKIVEARFGRAVLIEEAARDLVPKLTNDVIEEQAFDVIAQPEIEITSIEPLAFTATIPLRPTVTLGDYQAIRIPPRQVLVSDEQVDEVINRLRDQQATWVTPETERPAQDGDEVTIDLASSVAGEPLEEPQQDVKARLGEPGLLPEIQEAVRGLSVGEQAQATITFPEDHPEERVAGKDVVFDITLKGIQEKQLPAADDELASKVSDAETMDELRGRIRSNLLAQAEEEARRDMTQAVIDAVAAGATIEMPPVLIENQIDHQIQERRQLFERQGLKWERVLEITGRTEEQMRDEAREEAERRVRSSLALLEVARAEGITISEDEINAEINELLESYPEKERNRMRRTVDRTNVRQSVENQLLETRIIDRLVEIATEGRGYAVPADETADIPGIGAPSTGAVEQPAAAADAATPAAEALSTQEAETEAPAPTSETREER